MSSVLCVQDSGKHDQEAGQSNQSDEERNKKAAAEPLVVSRCEGVDL